MERSKTQTATFMDFITAYTNLTKSLARNDCVSVKEDFKTLESVCLKDQLHLSAEICNLMTSSHTKKSRAAWNVLLDMCSSHLDSDDFHIQIAYMAKQEKWWLIEDALDHGVSLDTSNPNIFKSFIACAPLETVQEILVQQKIDILPEDAVLSVCNSDIRVFDYLLNVLSPQTMQKALHENSKGVTVSGVRFPIAVHPWVASALQKKSIGESLETPPHSIERSTGPSRRI